MIGERKLGLQKHKNKLAIFERSKLLLMGGWVCVGSVGRDQKGPLNFLKFNNCNKKDMLIPNITS